MLKNEFLNSTILIQNKHNKRTFNYLYLLFNYLFQYNKTFFLISDQQNHIIKQYCDFWSASYILGTKNITKGILTNLQQTLKIPKIRYKFINVNNLSSDNVYILISPTNFYTFLLEEVKLERYINHLYFFTPIYLELTKDKMKYPRPRMYFFLIKIKEFTTPELIRHISFFGEFLLYLILIYLGKIKMRLIKRKLIQNKLTTEKNNYLAFLFFNPSNRKFNNKQNVLDENPINFLKVVKEGKLITTIPKVKFKTFFYRHQWRSGNPGKLLLYAGLRGKKFPRRYKNFLFIRANFQKLIIKLFAFRNRRTFFKYFVYRQQNPIYRFSSRINYYLVNIEMQLSHILLRLFWAPNLKCVKRLIMNGYIGVNNNIIVNPFFIVPVMSYLTLQSVNSKNHPIFIFKPYTYANFAMMHKVILGFFSRYEFNLKLLRRHKFYLYYRYKFIRSKLIRFIKIKKNVKTNFFIY